MWQSHEINFTVSVQANILNDKFEYYTLKITAISPRAYDLTHWSLGTHWYLGKMAVNTESPATFQEILSIS